MNRGDFVPQGPPMTATEADRVFRQSIADLSRLREDLRNVNPEMTRDIGDLLTEMRALDPSRFPGNPAMLDKLNVEVLAKLAQLELQMRRDVEEKQGGQVRSGATRQAPAGYTEAVNDYFRRLSKGK
jgi:hypothetical protein